MIPGVEGFMYPNEVELQWGLLIVLYPYITGLVAGAFILASLERVFKVKGRAAHLPPGLADGARLPAGSAPAPAIAPGASRALHGDVPHAPRDPRPWPCSVLCTCGTSWWCCCSRSGWSTARTSCTWRKPPLAFGDSSTNCSPWGR